MSGTSLIDTHAHCYIDKMLASRAEWEPRLDERNVKHVLLPNIDVSTIDAMLNMVKSNPSRYKPMIGIHPVDVKKETYKSQLETVRTYLETQADIFCGVGEIGLDYHWDVSTKSIQLEALKTQFEWAIEFDKAVSIHSRKSNHDMIPLITEYAKKGLRGIMHCFTGSIQEAHNIIDTGFKLGIGGVLTFKNAGLKEAIKDIDLKHIVLESDSPYLAPMPYRGKPNEPSYIYYVAEELAKIKQITIEEVAMKTTSNAIHIYNLTE